MEKHTAGQLQHRAMGIVDRVLRVFHLILAQARRLYSATAESTKLHVEREHQVITTHFDYHRLGEEVYRLMQDNPDAANLAVSAAMRGFVVGIKAVKSDITRHDERGI